MNDETVEQAIRRHERWLAEQENAIQQHTDAIRKHDEWREQFWAAMRAATERADRMDKRLERFEREGGRRLAALAENQASADARIAAVAENQATLQAALQALTAQIDRFLRGQQRNGHE